MRGDHLTVHYTTFYHHGIDCGDGTVIHLSEEYGKVMRTSYDEFANGKHVHIESSAVCFTPSQVVHRAKKRVGEKGYNLFTNNCEHFVSWCRTGCKSSQQVNQIQGKIIKQGAQLGSKMIAKQVSKSGSKFIAKSGSKQVAKTVGKTLSKGGGALIVADVAQVVVEQCGGELGLSQEEAKVAGQAVGLGGSITAGAMVAGPPGALAAAAVWGVGELLGSLFD